MCMMQAKLHSLEALGKIEMDEDYGLVRGYDQFKQNQHALSRQHKEAVNLRVRLLEDHRSHRPMSRSPSLVSRTVHAEARVRSTMKLLQNQSRIPEVAQSQRSQQGSSGALLARTNRDRTVVEANLRWIIGASGN